MRSLVAGSSLLSLAFLACACEATVATDGDTEQASEPSGQTSEELHGSFERDPALAEAGAALFENALPASNGRSCATCHVPRNHFTLTAEDAEARYQKDPHEPLFARIDADDPTAAALTFEHLRAGLVRVDLPLADNVDQVDAQGNVITNSARTVWVWRGVPSIENVALTAPYQYDGRQPTLSAQALGALRDHSQLRITPPPIVLRALAEYEQDIFSSRGMRDVAEALARGRTPRDPDPPLRPGSDEAEGKKVFAVACVPCHGGPRGTQIQNPKIQPEFFIRLDAQGSPIFGTDGLPLPLGGHDQDPYENLGISVIRYMMQIPISEGGEPNVSGLAFPKYRFRFYKDAKRRHKIFDLPPEPPALGPNRSPQAFTVDPGRAVISGDPAEFEAFDMPQLRGIGKTAPYFHDNAAVDLPTVIDFYSQFGLPLVRSLGLPAVVPPAAPWLPPEALTATQKAQLLAYMQVL